VNRCWCGGGRIHDSIVATIIVYTIKRRNNDP
jgi:hypothetical protein